MKTVKVKGVDTPRLSNIYICPDCGSQNIRTHYDFRTRETTIECVDCGKEVRDKEDTND